MEAKNEANVITETYVEAGNKVSRDRMKNFSTHMKGNWQLYAMFLLPFIWFLIFCYIPMSGLMMAFTEYEIGSGISGFFTGEWVGLKYFKEFFAGQDSLRIIRNTLVISLLDIAVNFPLPIILALLFDQVTNKSFKKFTQTIMNLPRFISMVIIVSIYRRFLSQEGLFNDIIAAFGGTRKIFLEDPDCFWTLFTLMNTWAGIGWNSIIYSSAMSGIAPEMYEAAEIDGASRFRKIVSITLPSITGTIVIMFILRMGQLLNVGLEPIMLLLQTGSINLTAETPLFATGETLAFHVYRRGVRTFDYSYATAVGLFQSLIGLILVIGTNWVSKKLTEESLF